MFTEERKNWWRERKSLQLSIVKPSNKIDHRITLLIHRWKIRKIQRKFYFFPFAYASSFSSVDLFSLFALFRSFICMTCLHLVTNVITVWHRWILSSSSVCRPSQFAFCSCNDEINLWHEMIRNKVKPNKCCRCCCFFSWKLHQGKVALRHNNNSNNKMCKKTHNTYMFIQRNRKWRC